MAEKKRRVCVVGVGNTASPGTHHPWQTWKEMAADAAYEAFADAHMSARELDACVCAYHGEGVSEQGGYGAAMSDALGISPIPVFALSANCCGGTTAFINAYYLVASGQFDKVLAIGGDKDGDNLGYTEYINISYDVEYDYTFGFRHRDGGSLISNHYRKKHGYKDFEEMAAMSYQTHWFARRNPKASAYGTPQPTFDSLNNASSLFSMMGEGQAACVLMDEETALKYTDNPIYVNGVAYSTDSHYCGHKVKVETVGPLIPEELKREDNDYFDIDIAGFIAADKAYKMAGISPEEVDVAQVYDLLLTGPFLVEALRLAPIGEALRYFKEGKFAIDGQCAVNTDGGNIARGHASGADGLNQIVENVHQLRGEAGERQVKDAKCAATLNIGSVNAQLGCVIMTNKNFVHKS